MGSIHDYTWSYQGEHDLLAPGFLRADCVTYGGQHKGYPSVPWELRRVVVLEALPKGEHPYSKRVFYFDAQTYALLGLLSYDHQGTFVRMPQRQGIQTGGRKDYDKTYHHAARLRVLGQQGAGAAGVLRAAHEVAGDGDATAGH